MVDKHHAEVRTDVFPGPPVAPVLAGPVEAAALCNVLLQAIALGHLDSLAALLEVVRTSFSIDEYQPLEFADWQRAFERFDRLP